MYELVPDVLLILLAIGIAFVKESYAFWVFHEKYSTSVCKAVSDNPHANSYLEKKKD